MVIDETRTCARRTVESRHIMSWKSLGQTSISALIPTLQHHTRCLILYFPSGFRHNVYMGSAECSGRADGYMGSIYPKYHPSVNYILTCTVS